MSSFSKNYKSYKSNIDKVQKIIKDNKKKKALEAAVHVRNKTVKKLSQPGTGKTYKVPGTNKSYTASSPGRPPAVLFGDLRKSIQFAQDKDGAIVGSELEKASKLEFGDGKVAARPFLKPTFQEEQGAIKKILSKGWMK